MVTFPNNSIICLLELMGDIYHLLRVGSYCDPGEKKKQEEQLAPLHLQKKAGRSDIVVDNLFNLHKIFSKYYTLNG